MKSLKNLKGFQMLNKQQLQEVKGAISSYYCKGPYKCCFTVGNKEYCEPGRCSHYSCLLY